MCRRVVVSLSVWLLGGVCRPAEAGAIPAGFSWQLAAGGRWAALSVSSAGRPGFAARSADRTGITFTNQLAETTATLNRNLQNGSGVALGDVDGDGWCDAYFCRLEGDNVLYRNLGDWRFEEITAQAGVACPGQYSTGAALADLDGDGDLDLLVNALGGGSRAFRNDGAGRFEEITAGTRLDRRLGAMSAALGDIDGDGDLDLYVANYRLTTYRDRPPGLTVEARRVGDRIEVTPADRFIPLMPRAGGVEVMERGDRDYLYVNDGTGRFAPVAWTAGSFLDVDGRPLIETPTDWGLTVLFRDLNGDLAPDIYVCNDFFFWPDRVWLNENSARFRAASATAFRCGCLSSMGGDFADINRDGHDDLFVADMVSRQHAWRQRQRPQMMQGLVEQVLDQPDRMPEAARNMLHLGRGDGTWAEMAQLAGVDFTEWSWGAVFLDVDLDGWEDLVVPTGNLYDVQDGDALRARNQFRSLPDTRERRLREWRLVPSLATPILAYRNNRDLTFTEMTEPWGFGEAGFWQGMALADLDNDGDLDVVVNRMNGAAGVFENTGAAPRIAVRLRGRAPNTRGVGARLTIRGGPVVQTQEMIAGGRYLSDDDDLRVFAAGADTNRLRIEVTWRDGLRTLVEDVRPNRVYEVFQADARPVPQPEAEPGRTPLFEDLTARLGCRHAETGDTDFQRQPLLSRKLSNRGPGVAWVDLEGQGWESLVVGAGREGRPAAYRNDAGLPGAAARRQLIPLGDGLGAPSFPGGMAGILGWRSGTDGSPLLLATRPWSSGGSNTLGLQIFGREAVRIPAVVPEPAGPAGALALTDVDGDGDLDLFAAGISEPGRYPEASASRLWRWEGDHWRIDAENSAALPGTDLVNGARFADLTGDGWPELLLACEWGPVRAYRNDRGRFREWNPALRWPVPSEAPDGRTGSGAGPTFLRELTGWWNGIAAGDFNADGRLDLVVTGWGRNTRFQRYLERPLRLYSGDLDGDGVVELLESYFEPNLGRYVPWRDYETVARGLPFIVGVAPTFRAYGEAGVEDLLGDHRATVQVREAAVLESLVLLNQGEQFEVRTLPVEAQFAPAFGVTVADFDGDGHEDLFLAQNFFGVEPESSRYDAGRGLLLRGDGTGAFTAMSGDESGIRLYGEQRASAAADFDADGRVDLVVTQNRNPAALFHNRGGRPGLRVRLQGPAGNPTGVGAVIRAGRDGRFGPAREVHAGSGWWSQDSPVTVLGLAAGVREFQVQWPGGFRTQVAVPEGAREVRVVREELQAVKSE